MSKLRKTLSILVAVALVVTLLTPAAFAADNKVQRVAGENRYETSADIALDKFDSADTVIIVNGEDRFAYADGLAASVLAGALDAPILLTDAKKLSDAVAHAIEELGASKAYILGGTTAVSKAVEEALEDLDLDITRLDGKNRYETAALIAEEADTDSKTAYVVNGWANADAMVAGAAAFNNGNPILLVEKDNVRKETADALKALGIENVIIVGGTSVVSAAVAKELDKDYDVKRIAGAGRYETSAVFAKETFNNPVGVSIVNGWRLADAIGASVYGNPILYANANGNVLDKPVENYLDELLESNQNLAVTLFGGPVALSNALQNAIQNKIDGSEQGELTITSVEAVNNLKLEVTFNKAIDEDLTVEIEKSGQRFVVYHGGQTVNSDNIIQSKTIGFDENRKVASVILDKAPETGISYTVALIDGDNNKVASIIAKSASTVLIEGAKQPDVTVNAAQDKIILNFNQRMSDEALVAKNYVLYENNSELYGKGKLDNYVLTNDGKGNWVDSTEKKAVEFKLNSGAKNKLLAGKTYKVSVDKKVVTSNGDELPETQRTITVKTPSVSDAQPEAKIARVLEGKVVVTFDKDLDDKVNFNKHQVTVKKPGGETITVKDVKHNPSNPKEIIIEVGTIDPDLTYTIDLPANGVVNAYYPNASNKQTIGLRAVAQKDVEVKSVTAQLVRQVDNKDKADLLITFDQRVDIDELIAKATSVIIKDGGTNYQLVGSAAEVFLYPGDNTGKTIIVKDVKTSFTEGSKGFVPRSGKTYTLELAAGAVKTEGGQSKNLEKLTATFTGLSVEGPEIDKVRLESAERIVVEFKEEIDASNLRAAHVTVKGYEKYKSGNFSEQIDLQGESQIRISVSGKTLTITPADSDIKFATGNIAGLVTIAANTIKSKDGGIENAHPLSSDDVTENVIDRAAPVIIGAAVKNGNTIEITYSEEVSFKGNDTKRQALQFDVKNASRNSYATEVSVSTNKVTVKFNDEDTFRTTLDLSKVQLIYTKRSDVAVIDANGTEANSQTITGLKNERP